ncbi:MAG: hypothetical protein GY812_09215 [Actinomycetia bacterium]|nr:hypothetical protein [Actinomycetes bacterium]
MTNPSWRRGTALFVAAMALVASSCGVAANDVAASLNGSDISTDSVDALAADEAFSQLFGFQVGTADSSVVSASTARTVLDFLLEGEALIQAAEESGLTVEADDTMLTETITGLQQQGYAFGVADLSDEARDFLSRFVVADRIVATTGGNLGEPTEADLRFVYGETADSGRWERTCLTLVAALADDAEAVADVLEDGAELIEVPDSVTDAQVAIDPSQACATAVDLAQLPPVLVDSIGGAEAGVVVGPIEVEQGGGPALVAYYEVESVERVDFESARSELEAEVAQSYLAVQIARGTEVNPRYGDGVALEAAQSQTGAPALVARVQRP